MMLSMSQEKLGDALGLTFQQVQKYEKGTNRIGASRLQQISQILQVPVAFFFEGAPNVPPLGGTGTEGMKEAPSPAYVSDFLATSEGLALTKAFMRWFCEGSFLRCHARIICSPASPFPKAIPTRFAIKSRTRSWTRSSRTTSSSASPTIAW
jgi:transcriptional regulator with XRE-family HTH domain